MPMWAVGSADFDGDVKGPSIATIVLVVVGSVLVRVTTGSLRGA